MYVNKKIMSKTKQFLDQQDQGSELGQSRRSIKLNQISVSPMRYPQILPKRLEKNGPRLKNFEHKPPKVSNASAMMNNRKKMFLVGIDNLAFEEDY
jgi:hypothetical protein